ncbi:MAG TPA: sensor domain-containing protein [Egicoccus sp.]|nr:sensor domain-containing protein [Egicoccus sp.]HSK23201.1 sensor domain-containing protein [Egicoccus sp.]
MRVEVAELPTTVGRLLVGRLRTPEFWRATVYHLLDGIVAWAGIALVAAGLTFSLWLTPVALIGLVLLTVLLRLARGIGHLERRRARILLDSDVEDPSPRPQPGTGFVDNIRAGLKDVVAWKAVAYLVVRFPVGIAASLAMLVSWYLVLVSITSPIWVSANREFSQVLEEWWEFVLAVLIGLVGLALIPYLVQGFAWLSRWLVQSLLGPGATARIQELEGQRSSAVRVADVDRRRIEQDLHDGAQVRLTSLAMTLGLAREAIVEGDAGDRVASLVEEAHGQAKLALREIRDLARGIHPAILTDRGLHDALASMVGRLPVPVELEVDVSPRPSPAVESVAYFVAAEALTNAVRHADSPTIGVRVVGGRDHLVVEVRDRGRGGADATLGTGLTNLHQRVAASGGRLQVESPQGVGTLVRAVIPCAS